MFDYLYVDIRNVLGKKVRLIQTNSFHVIKVNYLFAILTHNVGNYYNEMFIWQEDGRVNHALSFPYWTEILFTISAGQCSG